MPEIPDMARDAHALLARVERTRSQIADPSLRRLVGQLSGRLRDVQAQLAAKLPSHVAQTRARIVDARHRAEAIKARVPQLRLRAEEAERARQLRLKPRVVPPTSIDSDAPVRPFAPSCSNATAPKPATGKGLPGGNPQRPGWGH